MYRGNRIWQMNIILSGSGWIGGSIQDKEDSGDIIEFPLMSSIDILVDDEYWGSLDSEDCDEEDEIGIIKKQYVKENCLVKKEPPYYFRMVYGGFSWDVEFEIDVDDFDISKLQLIINDSSIEQLYGFIVDNVIYDGELIHCTEQSHDDIYEYPMSNCKIIETKEL